MQAITECELCDIQNGDETCLFLKLQPTEIINFCGDSCHDACVCACACACVRTRVCVCFKDIKKLRTKYDANSNPEIITITTEDYCKQLGWKVGAKIQEILLFTDHCAAHSKNTTFLTHIRVQCFAVNCIGQPIKFSYTKQTAARCFMYEAECSLLGISQQKPGS